MPKPVKHFYIFVRLFHSEVTHTILRRRSVVVVRPSDGHLPEILLPRDVMDVQSLAGHSPNERQSVEPGHTQKYEKQLLNRSQSYKRNVFFNKESELLLNSFLTLRYLNLDFTVVLM